MKLQVNELFLLVTVVYSTTVDAVQRAEWAVQASREALETAVEGHKNVAQSLSQLMDQAVDLGLKSKVWKTESCFAY